ncbi:2-dehydropantoate 2-reductase [Nocardia camponoti]|uniref:2-dehydropantoate 2-reductase n=1 Tax=Nocardia camponoti TaxID=1616106 RepID=A0A917Q930_9NOCA|nr:2-dehydropantoate 2-reductase [Nocardia camponoti]GGK37336.1 2-dehydropantoate 2-reductase [Nocardia camponoti]
MSQRVLVLGAGNVGVFIGGQLAAAGLDVIFVGRQRVLDDIAEHGLHLTDLDGGAIEVTPDRFGLALTPDEPELADLVLVTVKSADTAAAVRSVAGKLRPGTPVVSLQNGIGNASVIREILPSCVVLAGMVMFNVVHRDNGVFHRASDGVVAIADDPVVDRFAGPFRAAGLPLRRHRDLRAVQWAKLLLNLNNPINALSGQPLREQLGVRDFRRCLALAQSEALAVMNSARIRPAQLTPIPPELMVRLLRVPDPIFRRVFGRVLAVDPLAYSSMADDLTRGRRTEIAWLCGEIVRLGEMVGQPTPVNRRLTELVRAAEAGDTRRYSGSRLLAELTTAAAAVQG